mmetsp:Transcript_22756/g.44684  ORF Transcript_22756/g.44684 Transcript_22756/m.44684 type:complete len:295 (-) Transcript_22756:477-1361(-)
MTLTNPKTWNCKTVVLCVALVAALWVTVLLDPLRLREPEGATHGPLLRVSHSGPHLDVPQIVSARARSYFFDELSKVQRREAYNEHHFKIFIAGPESSGTRFLSRGIAQLLDPEVEWDGEFPICKRFQETSPAPWQKRNRTFDIVHISLPLGGGSCMPDDIYTIPIPETYDTCEDHNWTPARVFYDTYEFLKAHPTTSKTIFITRDRPSVMRSKLSHHCVDNPEGAKIEIEHALGIIQRQLLSNVTKSNTLEIEYEEFDNFPLLTWLKVVLFLDLHVLDDYNFNKLPFFKTGNK